MGASIERRGSPEADWLLGDPFTTGVARWTLPSGDFLGGSGAGVLLRSAEELLARVSAAAGEGLPEAAAELRLDVGGVFTGPGVDAGVLLAGREGAIAAGEGFVAATGSPATGAAAVRATGGLLVAGWF